MLRRVIESEKETVKGGWTKLPDENILTLPFTEYYYLDRAKEDGLDGACSVRGERGGAVNTSQI